MRIAIRPSFHLPACPLCSAIGATENPIWRYAHNTSLKRGRATFAFVGCRHAEAIGGPAKFIDEPEGWAQIEAAWIQACADMLAARTALWTAEERACFARALEPRTFIPGAVEELALEPVPAHYSDDEDSPF